MNRVIEPRILPLVEALNATGLIETIASCEGHFWRVNDPYVLFRASVKTASQLEAMVRRLHATGCLYHFWRTDGAFDGERCLIFALRAPTLDHLHGELRTFWNYVVLRKRIDADIQLLAEEVPRALNQVGQTFVKPIHAEQNNADNRYTRYQPSPYSALGIAFYRVFLTAVGARALDALRNFFSACVTISKARHRSNSVKNWGGKTYSSGNNGLNADRNASSLYGKQNVKARPC